MKVAWENHSGEVGKKIEASFIFYTDNILEGTVRRKVVLPDPPLVDGPASLVIIRQPALPSLPRRGREIGASNLLFFRIKVNDLCALFKLVR